MIARLAALLTLGILPLMTTARADDPPEPIRYTVRFPDPRTHYLEVEAVFPTGGRAHVDLMMAVWTPGSYLVREYARHVEGLAASSPEGNALAIEKTRKNRWRVATGGTKSVRVTYRVYAREMSVRTNWVDSSFALINGAPTFLALVGEHSRPHDVTIVPPPGWAKSLTGLADAPDKAPHHYFAPDYDTLVDCPILVGNPTVHEFEVDGKRHYLVNEGEGGVWDGPRSAKDVEAIVREQRKFWGQLPYDKYLFFNLIVEAGGGLEHKNSTVLMTSRWATRTGKAYRGWLELVSHEFFHVWNVKRLRPVELGPFDYENEVATKTLWVAEGLTQYYGDLLCCRAGLEPRESYLAGDPGLKPDEPRTEIAALQLGAGRTVQPLEAASYDAWIKYYRPDENTKNTAVSYYTKGAVVGFLLDAEIRRATAGKASLDDVMLKAYDRYSGEKGYTSAEFRAVASEVAGADLSAWFVRALETTEELDFSKALDWYGLRFKAKEPPKDGKPPKAWLGLMTKPENGRLLVNQVPRGTPGYRAGFNVGDEIVGIGEFRVGPEQWSDRMEHYRPGETVSFLVARRDRLIRFDATFGAEPAESWALEVRPDATAEQKARLDAWLNP
jgi:predicted metalloprotease with PDZ domain